MTDRWILIARMADYADADYLKEYLHAQGLSSRICDADGEVLEAEDSAVKAYALEVPVSEIELAIAVILMIDEGAFEHTLVTTRKASEAHEIQPRCPQCSSEKLALAPPSKRLRYSLPLLWVLAVFAIGACTLSFFALSIGLPLLIVAILVSRKYRRQQHRLRCEDCGYLLWG